MSRRFKGFLRPLLALGFVLLVCNSVRAGSVYAAFVASPGVPFSDSYGIAEFNSQTLQPINFFTTTGPTSGLTYLNGSIYDIENGNVYRRNATTGAILGSNSPLLQGGTYHSTAIYGGDVYVAMSAAVGQGAQFFVPYGTPSIFHVYDLNQVLDNNYVPGDRGYATGANGRIYSSTAGRLVVGYVVPISQAIGAIVGNADAVHLGQFTYDRDTNVMRAAATVNISGFGNISGIFNYNADTGNIIPNLIGPAGIPLSYEPNGVAYGFNGLYATNQSTIRRYGASDGSSQGSFVFTPFGISTTLGQLLFVQLAGDINLDGRIGPSDIPAMLSALTNLNSYESTNHLSNADLLQIADLNGDGKVTNADIEPLLVLVANGAVAAVPEPSGLVLFAIGGLLRGCFCWLGGEPLPPDRDG
jgi:hypothetical protein